jgi:WhiB family transcriptional regulator, redox-sensing transcriptional regulator
MSAAEWSDGAAGPLLRLLEDAAERPQAWQDLALCAEVDPEIFFPEKGGDVSAAKRVCFACEVRRDCLQYALDHAERWGIWGGVSERRRRLMRPGSKRAAA